MKQKKEKYLKELFRTFKNESKVPIIVESPHKSIKLEKELVFVIDPEVSFLCFSNTLTKKLEYIGAIQSQARIFCFTHGKQLVASERPMGEVFDKYRSESGWLEIQIRGDSPF